MVVEGLPYFAMPDKMKDFMSKLQEQDDSTLRIVGGTLYQLGFGDKDLALNKWLFNTDTVDKALARVEAGFDPSRASSGVFARTSASAPITGRPVAPRTVREGCSNSTSAEDVAATPDRSSSCPSLTATSAGPSHAGTNTLPTRTASPASTGRHGTASSHSRIVRSLRSRIHPHAARIAEPGRGCRAAA